MQEHKVQAKCGDSRMKTITRPLRYAGSWYEADPVFLERQIDSFFDRLKLTQQKIDTPNSILALVAPHAGYTYSGMAAAAAYNTVINKKVSRVFLLGPSHYVRFAGVALPRAPFFETPFGNLPVDQEVVSMLKQQPHFLEQEETHAVEHSLELQLPFIKKLFPSAPIVPMVVGNLQSENEVDEVAGSIKFHLQENDLIIASSDFTHYGPRFGFTPCLEKRKEKIQELDARAYYHLQQLDPSGLLRFYQESGVTICGLYPIAILLALLPQKSKTSLRSYYTSQDVVKNDLEHSVSYMAITFSKNDF